MTYCVRPSFNYRKVASSSLSRLIELFQIFRRLMKWKFDSYVLWPLAKKSQNWIVDQSTTRDITVDCYNTPMWFDAFLIIKNQQNTAFDHRKSITIKSFIDPLPIHNLAILLKLGHSCTCTHCLVVTTMYIFRCISNLQEMNRTYIKDIQFWGR